MTAGSPHRDPASGWRAAASWVLLDWAASGFSTISITLLVAYVQRVVFADRAWGVDGGVVWAWTLSAAMLVSAVVTPFLAAWADRRRSHRTAVVSSVMLGGGCCLLLAAAPPSARLAVATLVAVVHVAFDLAAIFTASLLPGLAAGRAADRLSAAGFAAGYAGGGIALVLATALVGAHDRFGLSTSGGLRASFALVGCWWILFSLPAGVVRMNDGGGERHAATSVGELVAFARSLVDGDGEARPLGGVLLGAVLVLGAVQTAIAQFSTLAFEEFHLDSAALVRLVLLVQVVALPGALGVGWLSTRSGRHAALAVCLAGWALMLTLAWLVQTPAQLTVLAGFLGLVLGGVQSVIRATVAMLAPPGRAGATFGLMQVGTKVAGFVASLVFGGVLLVAGHPRGGLLTLLAQLLAGWWLLNRANGYASPSTSRME